MKTFQDTAKETYGTQEGKSLIEMLEEAYGEEETGRWAESLLLRNGMGLENSLQKETK